MRISIIGAGPAGLFVGAALARRGHAVVAVDRDGGPAADGRWDRRGVMQFHHPHGVRPQVGAALRAELPEAHDAWLAAGAEPITFTLPDGRRVSGGMRSRRETFERALRAVAVREPGFTVRQGHVDAVAIADGRTRGPVVDGAVLPSDLVIDASGRSGRATRAYGPAPAPAGDTGIAYVSRQYRLHDPAAPGPMTNPLAWQARELLRLLDRGTPGDFGAWCDAEMRPWVDDHVRSDACTRLLWTGADVPDGPLPSSLVLAAAEADPRIGAFCGDYLAMTAGPSALAAAAPLAREVYDSGWRPAPSDGPTRDELARIIRTAVPA